MLCIYPFGVCKILVQLNEIKFINKMPLSPISCLNLEQNTDMALSLNDSNWLNLYMSIVLTAYQSLHTSKSWMVVTQDHVLQEYFAQSHENPPHYSQFKLRAFTSTPRNHSCLDPVNVSLTEKLTHLPLEKWPSFRRRLFKCIFMNEKFYVWFNFHWS